MATKRPTGIINDLKSKVELVDAGNGMGGVFKKGDGQKFKARAKKAVSEKEKRIADYRKEASRLASMANKRVQRLESNNLQSSPAYQGYLYSGGARFSVKGKTHNELQAEVARMQRFINAGTSTVKGVNAMLVQMAGTTGIEYSSMKDLQAKAPKFFELASKVEQYLRNVEDAASAIGYQRIWEAINEYVQSSRIDLSDAAMSVDEMVNRVSAALIEQERPTQVSLEGIKAYEATTWFKLKK